MFKSRQALMVTLYTGMALPTLFVFGSGAWLYNDLYAVSANIESLRSQAEDEEIATEPAAFGRLSSGSPESDGSRQFVALHSAWVAIPESTRKAWQQKTRDLVTGAGQEETAVLNDIEPFRARFMQVAQSPDCNLVRDWENAEGIVDPYYGSAIELSRLMINYAGYLGRRGKASEAFRTLGKVRRFAQLYARDGGMDAISAHLFIESITLSMGQELVLISNFNPTVIGEFKKFATDRSSSPNLMRATEGEAMRTIFTLSQEESYDERVFAGAKLTLKGKVFQQAAEARMIEFWVDAIPALRAANPDPFEMKAAYREALTRLDSKRTPSHLIPAAIAHWYEHKFSASVALDVRYQLALISAELFRYRGEHGAFPDGLNAVQAPTSDPLGDGSFGYRKTEEGFVLYSVGNDGVDDDGTSRSDTGERDIVLEVTKTRVLNEGS
ncbi:MAG: hypothetical protein LCH41_04805 [Armatimonadetes bacterium]|nr:hypothetical protein [Armatimonadota bacterium]